MEIKKLKSPNQSGRPVGTKISCIVIHATGGAAAGALSWMTNPKSQVSAHYLIDKKGAVTQLVEDDKKAWHAGVASWKGKDNVNNYSIGIELENDGGERYPVAQIDTLATLVNEKRIQYEIDLDDIVGHSQIAPGRKVDPGIQFPWVRFGAMLQAKILESAMEASMMEFGICK